MPRKHAIDTLSKVLNDTDNGHMKEDRLVGVSVVEVIGQTLPEVPMMVEVLPEEAREHLYHRIASVCVYAEKLIDAVETQPIDDSTKGLTWRERAIRSLDSL